MGPFVEAEAKCESTLLEGENGTMGAWRGGGGHQPYSENESKFTRLLHDKGMVQEEVQASSFLILLPFSLPLSLFSHLSFLFDCFSSSALD